MIMIKINFIFKLLLIIFSLCTTSCKNKIPSSLKVYDVVILWRYDGATSSYPWIDVDSNIGRCPDFFGGIEDPFISFQDVNNDGIEDIVFGNNSLKQIASIDPALKKWKIIRNDISP